VPPRVEYRFTAFGLKFVEAFKMLDTLEASLVRSKQNVDRARQELS
jgi:DNA-binding HxlR family transcriptional regulator